ncbi:MAG: helix-turn-helix domain-containing protein [Kutzneria sp.]|nr:helix-turn-helix domain-containing protein [Kutzneria sp.]
MTGPGQLGEFLRARRQRLGPGDVGLPPGTGLRRTPGLRREELATLAGVSVDYYVRLEQGRETNPSGAVLDMLATALRLGDEERDHLRSLADNAGRGGRAAGGAVDRTVRPGVRLLLDNLRPWPAYLLSRTSDVLAANPEALALFAGITDWPESNRNTIRYVFEHPMAPALFGAAWEHAAATSVANLRTVVVSDPDAADLGELVAELTASSAEFAELWRRHDVRARRGEDKTFHHPVAGDMTLSFEVLRLPEAGKRITVYQAIPGTADHAALMTLSASVARGTGRARGRPDDR